MSVTDYNARLYEKMKSEQDKYRDWLLHQEPSEILNHTYEYTMREDIVMCMEELELEPEKARALLRSPCPLSDVYTPFVKILSGVRRCGKSTILKMIMERLKTQRNIPDERIVSCRYDSMEYEDMTAKEMYAQLKERLSPDGKTYLFLDEVQEINGWEKVVNSF